MEERVGEEASNHQATGYRNRAPADSLCCQPPTAGLCCSLEMLHSKPLRNTTEWDLDPQGANKECR